MAETTAPERQVYILTFGQRGLRDGWVEVLARSYDDARGFVLDEYGRKWSMLYTPDQWTSGDPAHFPRGCIGQVEV